MKAEVEGSNLAVLADKREHTRCEPRAHRRRSVVCGDAGLALYAAFGYCSDEQYR